MVKNLRWILPAVLLTGGVFFTSCEKLGLGKDSLSNEEIVEGLKQALNHGTDTAVVNLHATDGFFKDQLVKILLPSEAQVVYSKLSSVPILSDLVDETILAINRAAEDAATEAKPIFINAIKEMTIEDGVDILFGSDSAATAYLRGKTYDELFIAFQPKIEQSLGKDLVLGISAEESYQKLVNTYNTASLNGLLFDEIEENSLSTHTTNKALKGVFVKVASEEKLIREDPAHRVTDVLEKVFSELDE